MKADSVAAITAVAAVVNDGAIQKAKQIGKAIKRIGRRPFALEDDGAQLFFPVGDPVGSVSVTARRLSERLVWPTGSDACGGDSGTTSSLR
jgi:hypothetical protein